LLPKTSHPGWKRISLPITCQVCPCCPIIACFNPSSCYLDWAGALQRLQRTTIGPISNFATSHGGEAAESLERGLQYSVGAETPQIVGSIDDGGLTRSPTCVLSGFDQNEFDEGGRVTFAFGAATDYEHSEVSAISSIVNLQSERTYKLTTGRWQGHGLG
jgi:hypothetical protein